jgi:hypothetical protein
LSTETATLITEALAHEETLAAAYHGALLADCTLGSSYAHAPVHTTFDVWRAPDDTFEKFAENSRMMSGPPGPHFLTSLRTGLLP